jgi:hypothetical protein
LDYKYDTYPTWAAHRNTSKSYMKNTDEQNLFIKQRDRSEEDEDKKDHMVNHKASFGRSKTMIPDNKKLINNLEDFSVIKEITISKENNVRNAKEVKTLNR